MGTKDMKEPKKITKDIIRKNFAGLINSDFLKKFPNYHAGGLVYFDRDGYPSMRGLDELIKKKYGYIAKETVLNTDEFTADHKECRENLFKKFGEYHRSAEARKG